jgi:hypothetical protein
MASRPSLSSKRLQIAIASVGLGALALFMALSPADVEITFAIVAAIGWCVWLEYYVTDALGPEPPPDGGLDVVPMSQASASNVVPFVDVASDRSRESRAA